MPWYLWVILFYSVLLTFAPLLVHGQYIKNTLGATIGALIVRPLVTWGLVAGGLPIWFAVTFAIASALEILATANHVGERQRVGGGTILWSWLLWGSTIVAVVAAA